MVEGYCVAYVSELTGLAGCAVLLTYEDEHRSGYRKYGWALGRADSDLAGLQALKMLLSSISSDFRRSSISITTTEPIMKQLETESNLSVEIKRWIQFYPNVELSYSNDIIDSVLNLAKQAAVSQENYDSQMVWKNK
jgi:hypothetical protein